MIKIFYLEDEPFLAQVVSESLEQRGFDVCHVTKGGDALNQCQMFLPDLCLLDVMVPEMDGYEVGRSIRKWQADLPIVFLTAKVQVADVLKGFESGGTDYLKKPFSMEELIVRIENQLHIVNGRDPGLVELGIGHFIFNPQKQELNLNEESWVLSFRESQLLQFLIETKSGIADRKEILLQLWGDDSFFNSRNLDVYIRKLRHRLAPDPTVKILTLKGVGYRVIEDV